jgi:hypothetical protein
LVDAKLAVLQIERVEFVEAAVDQDERAIVGGQAEAHIPPVEHGAQGLNSGGLAMSLECPSRMGNLQIFRSPMANMYWLSCDQAAQPIPDALGNGGTGSSFHCLWQSFTGTASWNLLIRPRYSDRRVTSADRKYPWTRQAAGFLDLEVQDADFGRDSPHEPHTAASDRLTVGRLGSRTAAARVELPRRLKSGKSSSLDHASSCRRQ